MEQKNRQYGICRVYCGQCPSSNGRVKMIAGELKRLVDTARYDWVSEVVKSFSFCEVGKGAREVTSATGSWTHLVGCKMRYSGMTTEFLGVGYPIHGTGTLMIMTGSH